LQLKKVFQIRIFFKDEYEDINYKYTDIIFKLNKSYYLQFIEGRQTYLRYKYSPGKDNLEFQSFYHAIFVLDFDKLKFAFNNWTDCLRIEVESDNIWNRIQENSDNIFDKEFYKTDEIFSENELKLNHERMKLLEQELMKIPLLTEQKKFIQNELIELNLKANKMSKKDWYLLLIGTFVTVSSTLGLSHEQGQMILIAIKHFFSSAILIP